MPTYRVKPTLWLEVGKDGVKIPISQAGVSYEMNRVPQAIVVLPVGRRLPDMTHSTSRQVIGDGDAPVKAKICMRATEEWTDSIRAKKLPLDRRIVLFDGDITNIGYRQVIGGYQLTARLTHWLARLNHSSVLSAITHPLSPAHFQYNAVMASGTRADLTPHFMTKTRYQSRVISGDLVKDLWGNGILPIFKELAEQDRINVPQLRQIVDNDAEQETAKSLDRFLTADDGDKFKLKLANVPDNQSVANAIWSDIAATDRNSMVHYAGIAGTTFWELLIGRLAPMYMFVVVPFPEHAAVVPYTPALKEVWNQTDDDYTIMHCDQDLRDMSGDLIHPVRGVVLYGHLGLETGASLAPENEEPVVGALYPTAEQMKKRDGMVHFKHAPSWLSNLVLPHMYSRSPRVNATEPDVVGDEDNGDPQAPNDILRGGQSIINGVTRALFANEVYAGRHGQIGGPVRFDICPGSTISIEGVVDPHMQKGQEYADSVRYATVLRVELLFDMSDQSPQALTNFTLGYIHTQAEHDDEINGVSSHPLYEHSFPGHTLLV